MALDQVIFMPAGRLHKQGRGVSPIVDRLLMTRLAIGGNDLFELTTLEVGRAGPSYTVDSVEELLRTYDDAALFLIMSADSLAQIDTWHEPDRLLSLVEWVVGPRPGTPPPDRSSSVGASARRPTESTCWRVRRWTSAAPRSADGWRPVGPSATLCRRPSRS